MKKLLALLSVATMMTSFGFANDGFYVGGSLGYSFNSNRLHHTYGRHDLGTLGFVGGGFVGYNFAFDCSNFDIGIEGFIYGRTHRSRVHHTPFTFTSFSPDTGRLHVHSLYNWGFRVLPGYYFMNCVEGHLIIGYTNGNYTLRDEGFLSGPFSSGRHCHNHSLNGFQVGGGLTLDLTCNLSLRFDGVLNGYATHRRRHNFPFTTTPFTTAGITGFDDSHHHHLRPYDVDSTVSIVYSF